MSNDTNLVVLTGSLGANPEFFVSADGKMKALNFSIAENADYFDKNLGSNGDWVKKTIWHNARVFGDYAEKIKDKYLSGDKVIIEASLDYKKSKLLIQNAEGIVEEKTFKSADLRIKTIRRLFRPGNSNAATS